MIFYYTQMFKLYKNFSIFNKNYYLVNFHQTNYNPNNNKSTKTILIWFALSYVIIITLIDDIYSKN